MDVTCKIWFRLFLLLYQMESIMSITTDATATNVSMNLQPSSLLIILSTATATTTTYNDSLIFLQCLQNLNIFMKFYTNSCQKRNQIDKQIRDFIQEETTKNEFLNFILYSYTTLETNKPADQNSSKNFFNFTPQIDGLVTTVQTNLSEMPGTKVWLRKSGCNKTKVHHINVATTTAAVYTTTVKIRFEEDVLELTIHLINCIWIVITTFATLIILILFKSFSFMRCIQMGQDLTLFLAHILILFLCNRVDLPLPCNLVSIAMQYLYLSLFLFLLLEALQAYFLVTNVLWAGGFLPLKTCLAIGYGLPIVPTAITGVFGWLDLSSKYSCWLNFDNAVSFGTLIPLLATLAIIAVIIESIGMRTSYNVPMNPGQLLDAKISHHILKLKVPANIGSWIIGVIAFYYPSLGWFSIMLPFNLVLGWFILTFHLLGNEQVRRIFKRIKRKLCGQRNVEIQ